MKTNQDPDTKPRLINRYVFNNYEHEDLYLCDKHNRMPYGMFVCDKIKEDPDNDISCQECVSMLRKIFAQPKEEEDSEDTKVPPGWEWER